MHLTPLKHTIWRLLAMGYSQKEIAAQLNLSWSSIKQHAVLIYDELSIPTDKGDRQSAAAVLYHRSYKQAKLWFEKP